ncbi:MAG: hypothetical protein NTZ75_07425 [Euryarchaeota archaeon]|nr:hypothetical protein [Euryarchaeota archaeon]
MEQKNCKFLGHKAERSHSIDDYQAKSTTIHAICRIDKMVIGGCKENCEFFELK